MSNVTMGRNVGALFMRTYGRSKATRKVDAWFSPDYRKKAFSSTDVSDPSIDDANDSSVSLKKRKKKGSAKTARTAKKKAISNLKERDSDEENVFQPDPFPKTTVASMRKPPRQPTRKRTDRKMLSSMSENEQPVAVVRRGQKKSARLLSTSESEEDSLMKHPRITSVLPGKNSTAKKSDLEISAGPATRGKYVTARRRVQSVKSRGPSSKPRGVLHPSLTLNSSDDFARTAPGLPRAVTRRKRLPLRPPVSLERTSSDVSVGPLPAVRRARALLRESLNASSDDTSLSCHAPLFSSTPSAALAKRLSQRLQDPSLSGIHFSVEDSATDTEPPQHRRRQQRGPPAHSRLHETAAPQPRLVATEDNNGSRSGNSHITERQSGTDRQLAPTKQSAQQEVVHKSQSVVVVEEQEVVEEEGVVGASQAAAPSPLKSPIQLDDSTTSRDQGTGDAEERRQKQHQASLELFSLAEEGGEEVVDDDSDDDDQAVARSISQAASGFVTAETRLCSLVEALKERCRTASPVVRLSRVHLSSSSSPPTLDTSSQILSSGETFSSCLDMQPAIHTSGRRRTRDVGTVPVLELSSCLEIPTPRLDNTVPRTPAAASSLDQAELLLDHSDKEEGAKGAAARGIVGDVGEDEKSAGEGREASGLEALVEHLKARCISCQPVILLDTLRLSPFLLRHHGVAAVSAPSAVQRATTVPVPAPQIEPESSASDSSALPASATPTSSSNSTGQRPDGEEPCHQTHNGQPDHRRPKRRRLSDSFPKVAGADAGVGPLSPERSLLRGRSKQPPVRVGTGRKACVSGLSANRWTKRDVNPGATRVQQQAHDSLDFGRAAVTKHGKEPLSSWSALPVTPARAEQLNISSILAGLSPDASLTTHMWSRLKAALSVHKKKTAFVTPRRLALSGMQSPAAQRLDASQDIFASPSLASLARLSHGSRCLSQVSAQEDISDAEKVYQECHQKGPLTFDDCIPPARMKLCRKIGEGTFGEVFSTTNSDGQPVALKIIPVEGKQKVNGEDQKTFGEILHEIIISKELSSLDEKEENRTDGFIGLNDLHCVQGSYPKQLLSAWDKFDKQRCSENDRPDFFGEEQLFLILEFEFGGSDLENMNGKLSSLAQAKSILQQVTAALAVAEQALCFEHRDLHWGNVLVKTTKQKECDYILSGETRSIESRGVQVNIIDYSLSRLEIDGLTVSCDISADEELFMGQGDYQFEIYRKMREENSNSWSEYHPHTNVLWLHYLTDKLLGMKYKSGAQGAQARALKSSLRAFHRDLLAFQSATDVLQHSGLFQ